MAPTTLPSKIELKEQTLAGRLAIVTGATRNIGLAITLALASRGCSVIGTYLTSASTATSLATLFSTSSNSITFIGVQAPITTPTTSIPAILAAVATAGRPAVDIIVNNASIATLSPLSSTSSLTAESLGEQLTGNIIFPTLLVQALLPHLSKTGTGRIVNISSEASHIARPNTSGYSASKAGLESLTRTWARELGQSYGGLTANTVAPGLIEGDLWEALPEARREFWLKRAGEETAVAGRIGTAVEIAGVVEWIVGDTAGWVSGSVVPVNGGAFCFS